MATLRRKQRESQPTNYDILTYLPTNKSDSFDDFCNEFAYDKDNYNTLGLFNIHKRLYLDLLQIFSEKDLKNLATLKNI